MEIQALFLLASRSQFFINIKTSSSLDGRDTKKCVKLALNNLLEWLKAPIHMKEKSQMQMD